MLHPNIFEKFKLVGSGGGEETAMLQGLIFRKTERT